MKTYDLVVIGTGTAAQVAAFRVRGAGSSVAVVDHRPFGGTCALRGCDPKKMLIAGAEAIDWARRMKGHGVKGELRIDWSELIAFKRSFTDPIPGKMERRFADPGIDSYRGRARFVAPDMLRVDDKVLKARHILIATGARPTPLGIDGEEHLTMSDRFMELETLPRRIVMVGGGYIAGEFSHIAARAGAQVSVLQRGARMLPAFDSDVVGWLMQAFRSIGVDVRTSTAVAAIEKGGKAFRVRARSKQGEVAIDADLVVHAAGRIPDLADLDLEAGGVATEKGRLKLNAFLQSVSNPIVYAAGDAAAVGPPLTPVSSHDAKVVAANLLKGNHRRPDYRGVPSVAFTLPPIARVGLGEAGARVQGLTFRTQVQAVPDWFTARRVAERVYGFKVMIDESTDQLLGAHLVGPNADEVVNLFGLAIRHGLTAKQLKTTIFAYPTGASDIGYMV